MVNEVVKVGNEVDRTPKGLVVPNAVGASSAQRAKSFTMSESREPTES